jgi:hypothetical protein
MSMAKSWSGTIEYQALLEEINRHQAGTAPKVIFEKMLPETIQLLQETGRMGGKTGGGSVYRQICKMKQTIEMPVPDTTTIKELIEQIDVIESQLSGLRINLEHLLEKAQISNEGRGK